MKRADVRMVQAGDRLGFPLEPLAQIGVVSGMRQEHLDGDGAVEAGVAGLVDLPHASCTKGRLDLVGAERGAGLQGHLVGRDESLQLLKEALHHDYPKVFAVLDHQKATIGRHVVALVAGEIECVRAVKE